MNDTIISEKLGELSHQLGVTDCCLFVDFADPEKLLEGANWTEVVTSRTNGCFSSERACNYASLSMQQHDQMQQNIIKSREHKLHYWHQNLKDPSIRAQAKLLEDWNYQQKVGMSIMLSNSHNVVARFMFFVEPNLEVDFDVIYESQRGTLMRVATELNVEHHLSRYLFADYGLLKPKTIDIVGLVSKGLSREQIANKMHMSVRGVDYHLDNAKLLFKVTTIPALISSASSYGMLLEDTARVDL